MKTILSIIAASILFSCSSSKVWQNSQRQGQLVAFEKIHRDTTILTFKPISGNDTSVFYFRLYGRGIFRIGDKFTIRYDSTDLKNGECKVKAELKRNY